MTHLSQSDRDDELDRVLVGGREHVTIVIADYDPGWPARFGALERRITDALGSAVRSVEHIGSTSVPGLAAKPIIDVLLIVDDIADETVYFPALEAAGFVLRVREERHRMVRTPERDAHIHIYQSGSPEIAAYLDLRDHLRADAGARDLYATKRQLAARDWRDMNDYADAKTDIIGTLLTGARTHRMR